MGLDSYAFSVAPLLGRRVVITGLVAKPHLNWSTGTAVSFDDVKGRYAFPSKEIKALKWDWTLMFSLLPRC
jgi:hypothetical protein